MHRHVHSLRFVCSNRPAGVLSVAATMAWLALGCGSGGGGGGGTGGSTTGKDAAPAKLDVAVGTPDLPVPQPDLPVSQPDLPGAGGSTSIDLGRGGSGGSTGIEAGPESGAGGAPLDAARADGPGDVAIGTPDAPVSGSEAGAALETNGGEVGAAGCGSPSKAFAYLPTLTNVAWDTDGNLLTAVAFYPGNGSPQFGGVTLTNNGSADILVAKVNPGTGNAVWTFTAGDSLDQWVTGMALAKTGIATLGTFKGTLDIDPVNQVIPPVVNPASSAIDYLVGLSDAGAGVWSKKINLGGGKLNVIAGNPNQDFVVVCGSAMNNAANLSATGTPGGGKDVVVAALKVADGTVMWAKLFGGANDQDCTAAAMDDSGNVAIAGSFTGTLDFGAGALTPAPTVATDSILWVAKLAGATGAVAAAQAFGTSGRVLPYLAALTSDGSVVVGGSLNTAVTFGTQTLTPVGSVDAFVAKLAAANLAPAWARRWGGTGGTAENRGVAVSGSGALTVVGSFKPTADTGPGATVLQTASTALETIVVTLDGASGQTLCAQNFGDAASLGGGAQAVAINRAGGKERTAIVGSFSKVINFGGATTALSSGATAGFLLEM